MNTFCKNPNKKAKKEMNNKMRNKLPLLSTTTFKSKKDYNRKEGKNICRNFLNNY